MAKKRGEDITIKLKCFRCGIRFKDKKSIFRDLLGYPICEEHLWEDVSSYWSDEFIEDILVDIRNKFNGNYKKWKRWYFKTHTQCDGEHELEWWVPNEELTEVDGSKYCMDCIDKMNEAKENKAIV